MACVGVVLDEVLWREGSQLWRIDLKIKLDDLQRGWGDAEGSGKWGR